MDEIIHIEFWQTGCPCKATDYKKARQYAKRIGAGIEPRRIELNKDWQDEAKRIQDSEGIDLPFIKIYYEDGSTAVAKPEVLWTQQPED